VTPDQLDHEDLPEVVVASRRPLEETARWIREFLSRANPDLGRSGPVCPFVKPALDNGLVWLTARHGLPTPEQLNTTVMMYRDFFLAREPLTGKDAGLETILMVFPDIAVSLAPWLIDATQARLKPEFVSHGLMIGQFHPRCDEPGLWNDDFRPLRAPYPMLVIRHMVVTDFPFLKHDAQFVQSYMQSFGGDIPTRLQPGLRQAVCKFGLSHKDAA
jgi:hypothetical protein